MSDVALAEPQDVSFSDLVKEAFIDPLRSVLIIDDQYPTWEQIFGDEGYNPSEDETANGEERRWIHKDDILKVIRQFRQLSPALTVDIHDGKNNQQIESYLHQSDLLVLDYQIKPEVDAGDKCVEIIQHLMNNEQFNLVVVHTMIDDLSIPFYKILMSLLSPFGFDEGSIAAGDEYLDERVAEDGNVINSVQGAISLAAYVAFREHDFAGGEVDGFVKDAVELDAFRAISDNIGWDEAQRLAVFQWGMSLHDNRVGGDKNSPRDLKWRLPQAEGSPWIRSSGGFVAFAVKATTDLLNVIQVAIEDWKPSPSRLMSARLRAEISKKGVGAEDNALSDKYAYWHYYQELRSPPKDTAPVSINSHRRTMLEGHAARHIERIFDQISRRSVDFGVRVLDADPVSGGRNAASFADHYGIKIKDDNGRKRARAHYNAHISTKPVSGWHLQPGHIFEVEKALWICLSPSCDLVPLQKSELGMENSSAVSMMPFLAARLDEKPGYRSKDFKSNSLIFLRQDGDVKAYSLFPGGDTNASPIWRLFTASDHGKFIVTDGYVNSFKVHHMRGDADGFRVHSVDARIVGQLRYEYALNLMQKLGAALIRVGLDFSSPRS